MMNVGTFGGLRRSSSLALVSAFVSCMYFLNRYVILMTNDRALFRRTTMAVIWARIAALLAFRTSGCPRMGVSSLSALLILSLGGAALFDFLIFCSSPGDGVYQPGMLFDASYNRFRWRYKGMWLNHSRHGVLRGLLL